jgi:tripartite-type tricarboxylate transporter receptor subunit TctC
MTRRPGWRTQQEHQTAAPEKESSIMGRGFLSALLGGCLVAGPIAAGAASFPTEPITIVVPYAPGATDQLARALADEMKKGFDKPVQVDTKPGAGGTIGANFVAKSSKADGHTLLFAFSSVQTVAPHQNPLPYGFKDLKPVARITIGPNIMAARTGAPFKNIEELVSYARANPEKVSYGSAGTGGATHLAGEAFARAAGIKLNHIPFQGVTPAVAAAVGGTVDLVLGLAQAIWPQVEGGRLVPIAQFGGVRAKCLPDLTTLKEKGIDLAMPPNIGMWVPAATPVEIATALEKALQQASRSEGFLNLARRTYTEVDFAGGEEFAKELQQEDRFYKELLTVLGMAR